MTCSSIFIPAAINSRTVLRRARRESRAIGKAVAVTRPVRPIVHGVRWSIAAAGAEPDNGSPELDGPSLGLESKNRRHAIAFVLPGYED